MKELDEYFKLQKEIYDHFGYVEDWVAIPLNDARDDFWHIVGYESNGYVRYADTKEKLFSNDEDYSQNEIYTQRFLPKWVYRGEEYTMICVDTHTDGNKFLQIFSNKKEVIPC